MQNIISETGYWISNEDNQHCFSPELSLAINEYVSKNKIKTVYDFGCGTGEYLQALTTEYPEIIATGFEGHQTDRVFRNIVAQDLSVPFQLEPAELGISIEVGEHIPKDFEQVFIDNVSNNSLNHLIMSWAIVGQGGMGHINCQNNDYVVMEFEKRGWTVDLELSQHIRNTIPNGAGGWLQNTLLFFNRY